MKSLDMVIVVPVSGLTRGDEALRLQVWEKVTALLRPELGKLYRQFNPSGGVWEHRISRPFGVVLGKQEPEVFHRLLAAGEEAQREAVAFHTAGMLRKANLGGAQKIGDNGNRQLQYELDFNKYESEAKLSRASQRDVAFSKTLNCFYGMPTIISFIYLAVQLVLSCSN